MDYKDLGQTVRFFCDNTGIPGFTWLTMRKISTLERLFWLIINVTTIITTIILFHHLWEDLLETPTIVTLSSRNLPVQRIKFPGVAICNVNKISRRRATEFATYLNQFTTKKEVSKVLTDIELLGNLYDFNLKSVERLAIVQEFFDIFDNYSSIDNPMRRMVQLSPRCDEMLKECTWAERKCDCDDLFQFRSTYDGFCCTFNYVRDISKRLVYATQMNESATKKIVYHPKGAGVERGLQVTLNNNFDDYFFSTFPAIGYTVQIFYPSDFPDKISGSLSEIFVNAGTEALISMEYSLTKTSDAVKSLPVKVRRCKFQRDHRTIFGPYRYSDCLVDCKIMSMVSLCNCVPFTVPVLEQDYRYELPLCTLIDIPCLNKYREKWSRYYPHGEGNYILDQEKHNSINCSECLPDCNSISYEPSTTSIPLHNQSSNTTHISIFFNSAFGNLYTLDVTQTWFEVISNFGGFLSLLRGVSVIGIIEILILLYRLGKYCIIRMNSSSQNSGNDSGLN